MPAMLKMAMKSWPKVSLPLGSFYILFNGLHERSACRCCFSWLHSLVTEPGSRKDVEPVMAWDSMRTKPLLLCACLMHAAAMCLVST